MVGIPTIGLFLLASGFYNRSSAVVAHALASRGRQANPVLTYETALRRFFAYGGVLRNPMMMADDGAILSSAVFSPMAVYCTDGAI